MPGRILKKLIVLILVPVAFVAGWLYTSGIGTLSHQIPGTDAAGQANTSCVYFFLHGFRNEVTTTETTCPRTMHLEDGHA